MDGWLHRFKMWHCITTHKLSGWCLQELGERWSTESKRHHDSLCITRSASSTECYQTDFWVWNTQLKRLRGHHSHPLWQCWWHQKYMSICYWKLLKPQCFKHFTQTWITFIIIANWLKNFSIDVKIIYLPPSITSYLQFLYALIIQCFKADYWWFQLRHLINCITTWQPKDRFMQEQRSKYTQS